MGWDDSDDEFDVDAVLAQAKAKAQVTKKSMWEEEEEEAGTKKPEIPTGPKKPKAKKPEKVIIDLFDDDKLETTKAIEEFASLVEEKMPDGCQVRGMPQHPAGAFFLSLFKEIKLNDKCVEEMIKLLTKLIKDRKQVLTATMAAKTKGNVIEKKNAKIDIADEMAVVYGEGDEEWSEEEWDEEEWDGKH